MNKQLKEQVRLTLEHFPQTRNSDALLIMNLYIEFYHMANPVGHRKLLEIMEYAKPSDIVRIRQKFNQDKRYLPTDEKIIRERTKRIKGAREVLGYDVKTQDTLIINSQLDRGYNSMFSQS